MKGVQKYERLNLRKGGRWRFILVFALSQFRRPDYLSACKRLRFFFHQVHPQEKVCLTLTSVISITKIVFLCPLKSQLSLTPFHFR